MPIIPLPLPGLPAHPKDQHANWIAAQAEFDALWNKIQDIEAILEAPPSEGGSRFFMDEGFVVVDAMPSSSDTGKVIEAFAAAASAGKPIWFTPRGYDMNEKVAVREVDGLRIYGNRAWLIANGSMSTTTGAGGSTTSNGGVVSFIDCKNITVDALNIWGGSSSGRGFTPSYFGHNYVIESTHEFDFRNCYSWSAPTDGFYVAAGPAPNTSNFSKYPSKGLFLNCDAGYNGRVGLGMIEGFDILILGGEYHHHLYNPPAAGVDIEPRNHALSPGCTRIRFVGTRFADNAHDGMHITRGASGGAELAGVGPISVTSCLFERNGGKVPVFGGQQSHAPLYIDCFYGCNVVGCLFSNCDATDSETALLRASAIFGAINAQGSIVISGNYFRGNSATIYTNFDATIAGSSAMTAAFQVIGNGIELAGSRLGIRAPMARAHVVGNTVRDGTANAITMGASSARAWANMTDTACNFGSSVPSFANLHFALTQAGASGGEADDAVADMHAALNKLP